MTVTAVPQVHRGFRHEAFVFHTEQDFLTGTLEFVSEAIAAGQPVVVAVSPARAAQLRAALGADAEHARFFAMADLGRNPAALIPALIAFITEHGSDGRPLRAVGEPLSAGRSADEVVECELHEALLNLAIHPDCALWLRCLYDANRLSDEVLSEAAASHPILVEHSRYRGSTTYGGAHHAGELFAADLPALPDPDLLVDFTDETLSAVDDAVRKQSDVSGIEPARVDRLIRAAHEAADNSIRHGGGTGCLRIWRRPDAIVLEIEDGGFIRNPLVGRTPPAPGAVGHGLWLVNQLADLVQIRSNERHTTVRILDRLTDVAP